MNTDSTDRDGLYKEYAEAGALCRSYESHARTSMVLFVPFATASIAFVFGLSKSVVANVLLCSLGILFSAATMVVLFRTREFNSIANGRAREIEASVGFSVYSRLDGRFKDSWLPSIKVTYMWVVGFFLACFCVTLVWAWFTRSAA